MSVPNASANSEPSPEDTPAQQDARAELRQLLFNDESPQPSSAAVDALVTSLMGPTARVVFPSDNDMTLKLVSTHTISRLEDIRSETRFTWNAFSITLGAILGFLTNIVTNTNTVPASSWVFLVLLGIFASAFLIRGIGALRRERKVIQSILGDT